MIDKKNHTLVYLMMDTLDNRQLEIIHFQLIMFFPNISNLNHSSTL